LLPILANVIANTDIDTFWWNCRRYRYRYFCKKYRRYFAATFCSCNLRSYLHQL